MATKTATHNLAGIEDLLLRGAGDAATTNQPRISGSVPITALNLVFVVDTIGDLRNLTADYCTMAKTKGNLTVGDGAGRDWYWDATSADSDDGISVIAVVAVVTGRWLLVYEGSVESGITADVGSIQGGSPLTKQINIVTVSAVSGDAVTLREAVAGVVQRIYNAGVNPIDVFPAVNDKLGYVGVVNNPASLAAGSMISYLAIDTVTWLAI